MRVVNRAAWLLRAAVVVVAGIQVIAQADDRAGMESRREQWQKVDEIFTAMGVRTGAAVADIGAGDGFFTSRLSRAVGGDGRVYAVDVSARALVRLRERVDRERLANVEVVEGAADDPKLPAGALDAVLIVNAYHEMDAHDAMLAKIRAALKPGGRLVIVEPIAPVRRDAPRADQTRSHEIGVEHVQQEARASGFRVVALQDPFTSRASGHDEEWLLVLTPVAPAAAASAPVPASGAADADEEWKSPAVRIPVDEFKRLVAGGNVLVVDVRDAESYARGHLPGATLITLEEIAEGDAAVRLRNETRPIVTYCS